MSAATDKLRDEIALSLATTLRRRWDTKIPPEIKHCEVYATTRAALDRYAAAIRAEERERAAGLVEALRANVWETAPTVAWLGLCDHDCGECHCVTVRAMEAGVSALAAYEAERGKE